MRLCSYLEKLGQGKSAIVNSVQYNDPKLVVQGLTRRNKNNNNNKRPMLYNSSFSFSLVYSDERRGPMPMPIEL